MQGHPRPRAPHRAAKSSRLSFLPGLVVTMTSPRSDPLLQCTPWCCLSVRPLGPRTNGSLHSTPLQEAPWPQAAPCPWSRGSRGRLAQTKVTDPGPKDPWDQLVPFPLVKDQEVEMQTLAGLHPDTPELRAGSGATLNSAMEEWQGKQLC